MPSIVRTLKWPSRAVIYPMAWLGYAIEWLVGLARPGWRFSTYSSIPFVFGLSLLSSAGIVWLPVSQAIACVYPLVVFFVLNLWLVLAIARGQRSTASEFLRELTRQAPTPSTRRFLGRPDSVVGAAGGFLFTIFFFGNLYYLDLRLASGSFAGVQGGSPLWQAWQLQYFSTVTILTIGFGDIHPTSLAAQVMVVIEALLGVAYFIVLFASLVSHHVSSLRDR